MELRQNQLDAIKWVDKQLAKENLYDIKIGRGIIINDLHKCLITKKERLIHCNLNIKKIVFLQIKYIKDNLNYE